jgi:uncharacterized protein (DUF2147 family)
MMSRLQCCVPRMWASRAALILLLWVAGSGVLLAQQSGTSPATPVLGRWLTQPGDGIIEITRTGDRTYLGTIIGGNAPHRVDEHNPDPGSRQQLLLGQVILKDMHEEGDGALAGGTIYEPDTGRTYKCRIEILDHDRLKVRGFIGFSLLGRSQVWTRFAGGSLDLSRPAH